MKVTRASSFGNLSRISLSKRNIGSTGKSPCKALEKPVLSSKRKSLLSQKIETLALLINIDKSELKSIRFRESVTLQHNY